MAKKRRSNKWAFLMYEESIPDNYMEILEELHVPFVLVALALETGARRGELLGIKKDDIFEYGIKIRRSISPTNNDTQLKTKHSKREISINKDIYEALLQLSDTKTDYVFDWNGFKQTGQLQNFLRVLQKLFEYFLFL
ncbi:hypothetical protein CYJ56_07810 [Facklamia hominis]|nr:hypothetical protein CYJ56_07810 [Facklamia hominis]